MPRIVLSFVALVMSSLWQEQLPLRTGRCGVTAKEVFFFETALKQYRHGSAGGVHCRLAEATSPGLRLSKSNWF